MPKMIVAAPQEPDMSRSQSLELIVDERVLDEIRLHMSERSGRRWQEVLLPQDDFSISNEDLGPLHQEITELLAGVRVSPGRMSDPAVNFLYALSGLCSGCIETGNSLFGYAD